MTNDKAPREWWIIESWSPIVADRLTVDEAPDRVLPNQDVFRVIEYSAFIEKCRLHSNAVIENEALRAELLASREALDEILSLDSWEIERSGKISGEALARIDKFLEKE